MAKPRKSRLAVHFSSAKPDWATPIHLFAALDRKYGPFMLDAAASRANAKVATYFDEMQDSLKQNWHPYGRVFCNPPYGRGLYKWVEKAAQEAKKGAFVCLLVPARTDTKWFHDFVYKKPRVEAVFLKGRIRFVGATASAPFPSLVVIFKPWPVRNRRTLPFEFKRRG